MEKKARIQRVLRLVAVLNTLFSVVLFDFQGA